MLAAADPFTTSYQSEEQRNLKQIQDGKYLIKKKTKVNEKVNISRFSFLVFLLLEEMVFLGTNFQKIDKVHVDREIRYYVLNHVFKASVKFNNRDFSLDFLGVKINCY